MKYRMVPGLEFESMTPQETGALVAELLGAGGRPQRPVRGEAAKKSDASGNVTLPFYTVPVGMGFRLTRLIVTADTATFGAPFNGAGAFLEVQRNGLMVDGISLVAGSGGALPAVFSVGITDAPYYENGDEAEVQVFAGPVSVQIIARFQGELVAAAPGRNGDG